MMFCIFKRKTAYEMRISDWSSDVCSSDLVASLGFDDRQCGERAGLALDSAVGELLDVFLVDTRSALEQTRLQVEHVAGVIGRASCSKRVCQYLYISVVAVYLNKHTHNIY